MTSHGEMPLSAAMMAAAAPMMIQRAVVSGDAEHGLMATGVVAGRLGDLPGCAELLDQIEAQARMRIASLIQQPFVSSPSACGLAAAAQDGLRPSAEAETPASGISTSLNANGG